MSASKVGAKVAPKIAPKIVPKIVIDARMLTPTPHGFARYVQLIASGLAQIEARESLPYRPVFLLDRALPRPPIPEVFETHPLASAFLSPREMVEIPLALRNLEASIYHSPTFSSLPYCPVPWIVTIHDLNHLTYGDWKEKAYYRLLLRRFARGARELLSVSRTSRAEIARWSGVDESRMDVVYNALEPGLLEPLREPESQAVLRKHGLEKHRYHFCLSNPKPHKNVAMLLSAYEALNVGADKTWPLVLSMPESRPVRGARWLGALDAREARVLLSCAGALVFPSLYEGFGLPPVEAAAIGGIPLLVSEIPAHVEALQDLDRNEVCWLDPRDPAAWTSAMRRVSRGEIPGVAAESAARVRARYSVQNLGSHMDRVYRRVLSSIQP